MLDEDEIPQYQSILTSFGVLLAAQKMLSLWVKKIIDEGFETCNENDYITKDTHLALSFNLTALCLLAEQTYRTNGDDHRAKALELTIEIDTFMPPNLKIGDINSLIKNDVYETLSEIINTTQMLVNNFEKATEIEIYEAPIISEFVGYYNVLKIISGATNICYQTIKAQANVVEIDTKPIL